MALVLSRTQGSSIYIGESLDPVLLEDTFDVKLKVTEIQLVRWRTQPAVEVEIARRANRVVTVDAVRLDWQDPDHRVGAISIRLSEIREQENAVGEDVLVARLAIEAPRHCRILRDNAKNRHPKGAVA